MVLAPFVQHISIDSDFSPVVIIYEIVANRI